MEDEIEKNEAFIALQKIKAAEEKARKIIRDARDKQSPKIIQSAFAEAKKSKENCLKKATEDLKEREKAIIQKAKAEARRIRKEAEEESEALRIRAEGKMDEAVEKVAKKINDFLKGGF